MTNAPINQLTYFAHAFGKRYELPIPLGLFVFAGAGVVLLSFFLVLGRQVKHKSVLQAADAPPITKLGTISTIISFAALALVLWAGFAGSQEIPENILPTLFWVIIWVGVALSAGVLGDWTQPLNPFANISKLANSAQLRKIIIARDVPLTWPKRLGWWPAVLLYYLIVAGELIFNKSMTLPANMAASLLVYACLCIVMGLIFGRAWLEKGEVFTVLFNTWGRLGFFRFGAPGRKGFLGGLDVPFAPSLSRTVFLLLLLGSVAFDGLLSTPHWTKATQKLTAGSAAYNLIALFCLALSAWILYVLFTGFAIAVSRAGRHNFSPLQALAGLLPSLLPISFAYLLAHYLQYLLINGQLMFPLIGNPAGLESWPIHMPYPFNDSYEPNVNILSAGAAWYIAVAVIVIAHILAVVLAHRHLGNVSKPTAAARRSEYPWIAAMVFYTMLSLWLLAQPLVKEPSAKTGYVQPARALVAHR